jgi:formate hydrogenlyase subunit 3/multisubunit Na+/H+ antiporter MnhD subunit
MKSTGIKFHEWVCFGGMLIIAVGSISALEAKSTDNLVVSAIVVVVGIVVILLSMGLEKLGNWLKKPVD